MMLHDYDITNIERDLHEMIRQAGVSKNIFDDRPLSTNNKSSMADFVVARVMGSVEDMNAYGTTTCTIHLFAKDVAGYKNSNKLSVMYNKLVAGLTGTHGRLIFNGLPSIIADATDGYGYHARILNLKTIIKII